MASVIGRTFAYDVLYDIFPVEEAKSKGKLKQYLVTLTSAGLVYKGKNTDTYTFKHTSILECCYNLLLPSQRQQLHATIAEWYEQNQKTASPPYHILAHHWLNANRNDKALDYLELAGEKALACFANVEAVDFFTQTLALVSKVDRNIGPLQRARWERCLGEAYYNLGKFDVCCASIQIDCLGIISAFTSSFENS